tara:strand:+ start:5569 stop:5883 length:315 start_codon:yes stop_codon:yes gene_type:complete
MSNGIQNPLCLNEATDVINEYAFSDNTEWIYSGHADERAEERLIGKDWVEKTLSEGSVISVREHILNSGRSQYRYKVRYTDNFGKTEVITVIPSPFKLVIITEW